MYVLVPLFGILNFFFLSLTWEVCLFCVSLTCWLTLSQFVSRLISEGVSFASCPEKLLLALFFSLLKAES